MPAYTDGLTTHFSSVTPPVGVAAHEFAHQFQHAALRDHGAGAEGHAQAVAGRSRRAVGARARRPHGNGSPRARDFTVVPETDQAPSGQWQVGGTAKVGDEGRTVTTDADNHALFAD